MTLKYLSHIWRTLEMPLASCEIKMIVIDLSKQQKLDAHPKAIINFTGNIAQNRNVNTTMVSIIEEPKETILDFSQGSVRICKWLFR